MKNGYGKFTNHINPKPSSPQIMLWMKVKEKRNERLFYKLPFILKDG